MSARIEVIEPMFRHFLDPEQQPERLVDGCRWTEGPVYVAEQDCLLFNDIPNCRMLKWSRSDGLTTVLSRSEFANGNTLDLGGNIVSCEHGGRRVIRRLSAGTVEVIADRYAGKRLNSPNDVVVKSDGSIWFTDPPYGINSDVEGYPADSEIGANNVYRVDPQSGEVTSVAGDFDKPNGLAFSPDESLLYIADSGAIEGASFPGINYEKAHHIRVFDVTDGSRLGNGRVFAEVTPGVPDGFRVDTQGFIWTSSAEGVHCYSPGGELVGKILLPEVTSNLVFGGTDRSYLFITATTSVYGLPTRRRGAGI